MDGWVDGWMVIIAHKIPEWSHLRAVKKRLTPAGMLTQNLYHQYLLLRCLSTD